MSLSCLGLLGTLSVYALLPELRNLPGRVVINLSVSLLLAYAVLMAEQLGTGPEWVGAPVCKAMGETVSIFLVLTGQRNTFRIFFSHCDVLLLPVRLLLDDHPSP